MEYRIYHNRIALIDDAGLALAEIDFPKYEAAADTVEITHTFVDESLRGQGVAGKLMERLITHLRKNHLQAYPRCSYAVQWFKHHPEVTDLLCPEYASEYPESFETNQPQPASAVPLKPSETIQAASYHSLKTSPYIEEEEIEEYEENPRPIRRGIHAPGLGFLSHGLQFLTAGAFLLIFLLIAVPAFRYLEAFGSLETMIRDQNLAEMSYIGSLSLIGLLLIIWTIWSLTHHTYTAKDQLYSADTGRGLTASIILIILLFLSTMITRATSELTLEGILAGLRGTFFILSVSADTTLKISIATFIFCLIRKIIGA